ncbi:MAG: glycoside hydrolase family 13 protein [Bacteroidota bacterium]
MKSSHRLLLAIPCFCLVFSFLTAQNIKRVEPPNWWVGMQHPKLQLLVYGENIGQLKPSIDYPGVQIDQVIRVDNDNYLFIDLDIQKAKAGNVEIVFRDGDLEKIRHSYPLLNREPNAANRQGFDNSDVLCLITPDRFVNGDPSNDDLPGMLEKANRSFKGGRHGGDIAGIQKSLDYLADMGYTAIWLNPVLENNMPQYSYHGYAITDFYQVDPRFGSNESYRQLSQEAQKKGIGMIMDMIVNHCGLEHWWMKDLPSKDWINQWSTPTFTNHRKSLTQDPHAAPSDRAVFFDGWFVPTMPDLNQRHPLMAEYLTQNSIWWVEYAGLRGIRMDTYPYPDIQYMSEWTERLMKEYPQLNIVGEEWSDQPSIIAFWQRGKNNPDGYTSELPSLMDFPLQMALAEALTTEESWNSGWIKLYTTLAKDFLYPDPDNLVVFPDNHDMPRFYAQVGENDSLYQMGLVYMLTTRGIPQLYYGTEIAMSSPSERDDGLIRSDFPGGWAGDEVNVFMGKGLSPSQQQHLAFTKRLMNWRKGAEAIHWGKLMHYDPKDGVYVYFRYTEREKVMVILNKNREAYDLNLGRFGEMLEGVTKGKEVLTEKEMDLKETVGVPALGALVLELK